ncbi:glycosyl transferase family protein [Sphingomonas sp. LHG3406-1]|uniref:glycosyl transferase family protein n=1 Tax=Sphingomonas sp. LHG3406-1 TaxID=2804617 RepID=UPI00263836C0|nr:glycosyl transferase family protein [Sphingomonas sp. LHG3406-1]
MSLQNVLAEAAAELALFAALGFLLFSLDDLAVDAIFFVRRVWRAVTVYRHHPHADARSLVEGAPSGWMVVLIPAWDEASVIGAMLRAALKRFDHPDYTLLVGYYRNDPATRFAIEDVPDPRVMAVEVPVDGPTTKADCLNHLYSFLVRHEAASGRRARAVVLHDAEDLVHPLELRLFDRLVGRAGVVQLPVVPLPDRASPWIGGHYCDEFAESHGKELVVREAVGAAIPLAGVGCAIAREAIARLAAAHDGRPFAGGSMTEDYEMGLRLGALGERTIFVRLPASSGEPGAVASRGHFPGTLGAAVRQKARWLGGIAFAGWDRLGWRGGLGERWFRLRDRRGPLAALLLLSGYVAAALWGQLWFAAQLGAPLPPQPSPLLATLLQVNFFLLLWRMLMRITFTTRLYGFGEGLASVPRVVAGNLIAILAAGRALFLHAGGGPKTWDKTAHTFPAEAARS